MKTRVELLIAFLVLASRASGGLPAAASTVTQDELVRRTQELFDAVAAGDKTPWQKYYSEDCIFHDEKGRSLDKTKLIADIEPLPAGYSGTIKVKNPDSPAMRRHRRLPGRALGFLARRFLLFGVQFRGHRQRPHLGIVPMPSSSCGGSARPNEQPSDKAL